MRASALLCRFYKRFLTSVIDARFYRVLYPGRPLYALGAIKEIGKRTNAYSRVFEWGSGQSSIWYSRKVKEYFAVEHNREWYDKVSDHLRKEGISNAQIIFAPKREYQESRNQQTLISDSKFCQLCDCVLAIDGFPDHYFDCIIIDGKARVPCCHQALPKLSPTGTIVLDDSARDDYQKIFIVLKCWNQLVFNFGFHQTTLFFR